MDLIYDIFKKLSHQEVRYIRHQITASSFEYEKVGKLFELVTQYEEQEESFYSQELYQKEPDNTFRVTKSRLKRMMENVMLNDKSLSGYGTEIINIQLQVKKKLLQAEILLGRGAYAAGKNLLMQCISTAQKYQLYQEAFQAEFLMFRLSNIRIATKEFEQQTQLLKELNENCSFINEALILHYHTTNLLLHKSLSEEQLAEVRLELNRVAEISNGNSHPLVLNTHYLCEIYYFQVTGDFTNALFFCEKYLKLIQENPTYYTKQRLAGAYIQLSQVSLQLGETEKAQKYSEDAVKYFSADEMNYLVVQELMFRISFYAEKFDEAESYISKAFKHPQFETSKMRAAQWQYFKVCVLVKKQDFKNANRSLSDTTPLLSDKYGWNLYVRLLEIVILFELQLFDPLDARIQNMRQFLKRANKNSDLYRFMLLLKILREWYKAGYDFTKARKSVLPILKELQEYHEHNPFRKSGFELIRFEKWFAGKLNIQVDF
jgi:hypothetical protein